MSIRNPVSFCSAAWCTLSLSALFLPSETGITSQRSGVVPASAPETPLAFVRTLALTRPKLALAPPRPLGPAPDLRDKKAAKAWNLRAQERRAVAALKPVAQNEVNRFLAERLSSISGLSLVPQGDVPADATLHLTIDRIGAHTGAAREIWLRVVSRLETRDPRRSCGPYYAVGQAASIQWMIKPGFVWSDSELMAEAARQAARQICHSLKTGREGYFGRQTRIAVIPAITPDRAEKAIHGQPVPALVDTALLARLADVLFQPGLTPIVETATEEEMERVKRNLGPAAEDFWQSDNSVNAARIAALGAEVKADYVFASRIGDVRMDQHPATILQFGVTREGVEVTTEVDLTGVFVRTRDSALLWSDHVTGSSTSRTQFTRHGPRIRRDEQSLADAARVAYAYLRSSFENHKRQFEK